MTLALSETIEYFIINASMVGLGITLALYSFILPQMNKIFEKQAQALKKSLDNFNKISKEFGEKLSGGSDDTDLQNKLNNARDEVNKNKEIPFHNGLGFLITGIFFCLSMIFPTLNVLDFFPENEFIFSLTKQSPTYFIFGVGLLIFIWICTYLDLKDYLKKSLDDAVDEADKKLEESKKSESDAKKKFRLLKKK